MEKLDSRYDSLSDYLDDDNTYLIPKKENKFTKIINYINITYTLQPPYTAYPTYKYIELMAIFHLLHPLHYLV